MKYFLIILENNLVSVLTSYSDFDLSLVNVTNNYCYTAFFFEKGNTLKMTNFSCLNLNSNQYSLQFGSCLDLKNTRNATIQNIEINSCFSQTTACGIKIYLELETERNTLYNEVSLKFFTFC